MNPSLPSALIDKQPVLEEATISEMPAKHQNVLHVGCRAFIEAQTSEQIPNVMRHQIQIQALGGQCQIGDKVYYKETMIIKRKALLR